MSGKVIDQSISQSVIKMDDDDVQMGAYEILILFI